MVRNVRMSKSRQTNAATKLERDAALVVFTSVVVTGVTITMTRKAVDIRISVISESK